MDQASVNASAYASALTEAQLGIQSTDDDWNWYANAALVPNAWFAFMGARGDNNPGSAMIHLMKSRIAAGLDVDNGRFGFYFADAAGTPCVLNVADSLAANAGCTGNRPGANSVLPDGSGNSSFYAFNNLGSLNAPAVTFAETQLIVAEAAFQTGNAGLAQTALNKVRANEVYGADAIDGTPLCTPKCAFTAQPPVAATLQNIMEEGYIDLLATPEVYNNYKRTCFPWLAAAPASPSSAVTRANLPGRIPYGLTAINADPNTPNIGSAALNANQPTACPTLTYSSTPAAW